VVPLQLHHIDKTKREKGGERKRDVFARATKIFIYCCWEWFLQEYAKTKNKK
jgi:hypothetical protein